MAALSLPCDPTDPLLHAADPADWSVQRAAQQHVVATGPPGHAPAQPVLHPAGVAAEQRAKVTATEHNCSVFCRNVFRVCTHNNCFTVFVQAKTGLERPPPAAAAAAAAAPVGSSRVADCATRSAAGVQFSPSLLLHLPSLSQQLVDIRHTLIPSQYAFIS